MGFLSQIEEALWTFTDGLYHTLSWFGVVIMMAIESACIPLPSEVIMPLAGQYLVTSGSNWAGILEAGFFGALGCTIGSIIAYWVGALGGRVGAVAKAAAGGGDVVILCAGFQETFAVDDAYCAGRIVALLEGDRTDPAMAAAAIARAFPTAWEGVNARTYGPPGLEDDLKWCTQENTLDVVPRFARMVGSAAEVILDT